MSSQRGESYHSVMREITNGQLSIEDSAKRLISKTLSILKDMAVDEDISIRKYTRTAQLAFDGVAFQLLRNQVSIKAMKLLEIEWKALEDDVAAGQPLGDRHCQILLRYGIACKHYLKRIYDRGEPIPRSFLHPRWWLQGPITRFTNWRSQYPEEQMIDHADRHETTHNVWAIRNALQEEERARFDHQLQARDEQLAEIGRRYLMLQELPIGNPDPVPKQKYIIQKKVHGRADARGLTGAELADRALIAKEKAERSAQSERDAKKCKARAMTPKGDDGPILIPASSPRRPPPLPTSRLRRSPSSDTINELPAPASTAPARLTTGAGRQRVRTWKATEAKAAGWLPESQPRE
jgi:hypothetical protein